MATVCGLLRRQGRWAIVALLLAVLLLLPMGSASAYGGSVSGEVTDPEGGLPPAGTVVRLLRPNGLTFGQTDVEADGSFSFAAVPNGGYIVRAVPPVTSDYTRSLPHAVSVINSPVDVGTLALTNPSIVGTVYAPDGLTPTSAWIRVYGTGAWWLQAEAALDGEIKVGGLPPGTFALQALPMTDDPYWDSPMEMVTVSDGVTQTITLTLTAANVYGYAADAENNPVPQAVARVHAANGSVVRHDETSASGLFAVGGLTAGGYVLTLQPPWHMGGLVPPPPMTFTVGISPTNLGTINFGTAPKIVTGTVKTNLETPVEGARIEAHRADKPGRAATLSDGDGAYNLRLTEGLWMLTVKPISTTTPARWIYPYGPQVVHFRHDTLPEQKTVNFRVVLVGAESNVTGSVEMPDGSPPPFTVTVGLRSSEGIGRAQVISPTTGAFDIPIPPGVYNVFVHPANPGYLGPVIDPIRVPPSSTYVITPPITLLERNAVITGTVSDGDGDPVADVPVGAWQPDAPGTAHDQTLADGSYILAVVPGTWLVRPAPRPDQSYLYNGPPTEVDVPDGGTVPDVNFVLTEADSTIVGLLVDGSGNLVTDVGGWGYAVNAADPSLRIGTRLEEGQFAVLVPAGDYHVGVKLSAGGRYVAPMPQQVSVGSGSTVTVTFALSETTSRIVGALWDRDGNVVTGVRATVTAFSQGIWLRTTVDPDNGLYALDVTPGIWTLGYEVDPASAYVALRHRRNYPVAEGQTVVAPLPVARKDGLIKGTVLDPDGVGLDGATVVADGIGRELGELTLRTLSGADGAFELAVPHGRYVLRATLGPGSGWINPASLRITVPPSGTVTQTLQFLRPDATISGTVDISGTHSYSGTVHLWAWSPGDGYVKTTAPLGGEYALSVISNTVWHVGAAFQAGSQYWLAHALVAVPEGGATRDLVLRGPFTLPSPVSVSFDAGEEQYLDLADGTSIYIPAGAMPVSGTVTLQITPIATFPHQRHANVYRYGYAFTAADGNGQPIEQQFNQDVLITFSYDEAELRRMGLSEQWLKPAYFSTTTDSWTFPESYVVDTVANVVAMQIDHFTDFALTGTAGYQVFLPLVLR